MSRTLTVTERTVKPDAAAATVSNMREKGSVMLLDEKGRMPRDSIHFAEIVYDALEQGGSRLGVVIGGAEGLPKDVVAIGKENNVQLISLSPLTFTHKMVRDYTS